MKSNSLGELEQKVMETIWVLENGSIKDVLTEVKKERKIAYTTVATILQRLLRKGLLIKKGHRYSPAFSKSEYSKKITRSFFQKILRSFGDIAIVSFAESIEGLPKKKRESLLRLLKDHKHR